jgi:DNA polymerase
MLAAVAIDRKKEVFITNILKCRPPGNRTPESAEILACMPLLEKQIAIVRPKFRLLLGRIAAHSLLELTDSISKMRAKVHDYRGIPAIVTYHPAAILRNVEYRAPTDEDLRKLATLLKESGHHGDS